MRWRYTAMEGSPRTLSSMGVWMKPGADAVGPHALGPVVDGQVLGQEHHPALGSVVGAAALGALDALDAGDVDQAAPARLDHGAQGVLGHQEGAHEVDVDDSSPFGHVEQVHGAATGHPGRVDHRVEPAVGGEDGPDQVGHGRLVGHVHLVVHGWALVIDGGGQVDAHHGGAFFEQSAGRGSPDPRGGPGDQGHGAVESSHVLRSPRSSNPLTIGCYNPVQSVTPWSSSGRHHRSRD